MSPFKRGNTWHLDIPAKLSLTGKRDRPASEARTFEEAEALERELKVLGDRARKNLAPGTRNPHRLTLLQAAHEKLAAMEGRGGHDSMKHAVKKHIERSGLGALLLEQITTQMIEDYLDALEVTKRADGEVKETKASRGTRNRLRSLFSGIFRFIKKRKRYFGENPISDVEYVPEAEVVEDRVVPPELVRELLADAPSFFWRLCFALAVYAGLRRGEVAKLDLREQSEGGDIDLGERVLVIRKGKDPSGAGRVRHVGVHLELVPLIEEARRQGLDLRTRSVQDAAEKVKDTLAADYDFHGLRHTWTSQLEECGAKDSAAEYMGWGRRGTTRKRRYMHIPAARLRAEIDRLVYPGGPSADDVPQPIVGHEMGTSDEEGARRETA